MNLPPEESGQERLWRQATATCPRLHDHIELHRHVYRGQTWFVAFNPITRKSHRFSEMAHAMLKLCDGERTVESLHHAMSERFGAETPSRVELLRWLQQFSASDIIAWRGAEALNPRRSRLRELPYGNPWLAALKNPLSVRVPLCDPDRLLTRTLRWVKPCFSLWGAVAWCALLLAGGVNAAAHWPELTQDLSNHVLAPDNLIIMALVYPLIKALHEFGHAYAIKYWGGAVHEMGLLLLIFMPVPYVEASHSAVFASKYQRMAVGAAGIAVELAIAAAALLLWTQLEPGALRSVLYSTVFISGVATLLFNGNPLLRFDGYYVFADALEIPNLAPRAAQFAEYVFKRHVLGLIDTPRPATYPGEVKWLLGYGVAAFCYRLFVVAMIIWFIAGQYFVIGVLLAIWAVYTMVLRPWTLKIWQWRQACKQSEHAPSRYRVFVPIALLVGLLALPFPHHIVSEGVVWLDEHAQVRAESDGELVRILALPGTWIRSGDVLFELDDPFVKVKHEIARQRLMEYQAQYDATWRQDAVQAQILRESIATARAELAQWHTRIERLRVISASEGWFIVPHAEDMIGRFFRQGTLLAYVSPLPVRTARVVIEQADIALVRARTRSITVRAASDVSRVFTATTLREVPEASKELPSRALSRTGGGKLAPDPDEPTGRKAYEAVFQMDLLLDDTMPTQYIGERVHVRFTLSPEPLAMQGYRQLRRLFLAKFAV